MGTGAFKGICGEWAEIHGVRNRTVGDAPAGEGEGQAGTTTKEQEADRDRDALWQYSANTQQAARTGTQHSGQSAQGEAELPKLLDFDVCQLLSPRLNSGVPAAANIL